MSSPIPARWTDRWSWWAILAIRSNVFRHFLGFTPTIAIDIVPTADQAALQGLRIRFQTAAANVPEPATLLLAGLASLTMLAQRRRGRSRRRVRGENPAHNL